MHLTLFYTGGNFSQQMCGMIDYTGRLSASI